MSSIPRGPNQVDAAEPPTPGANLPRPSLDQTLVGVAPTVPAGPPSPQATPIASPADEAPEAEQPIAADRPKAIVAAPMIAVSHGASNPKLDAPVEPVGVNVPRGLVQAEVDPALQSTALASDYLKAARDAALGKASVPRPRRPTAPALAGPSAATLRAYGEGPAPEPTKTEASDSPMAASPQSIGTQTSVAPPLPAAEPEDTTSAPSHIPSNVSAPSAPAARGSAPAQSSVKRFEPVPTVRAPLWEQAPPSVGRPLPLEHPAPDWDPLHAASSPHGAKGQRSRWYRLRWVALAAAVLAAAAFAIFGEQLTRPPEGRVKLAETGTRPLVPTEAPSAAPPEQRMLANRPASEPATAPAVADLPATATSAAPVTDESASTPVIAPAAPTSDAVGASKAKKKPVKRSKARRKRAAPPAAEPAPTGAR